MMRLSAVGMASLVLAGAARAEPFFAASVVSTSVGAMQNPGFADPSYALGGPRGEGITDGSVHVYNLGIGGSITLAFDAPSRQRFITDGPGSDFIVFENAFYAYGEPTLSFAELAFVEVSSNGMDFARFPVMSLTTDPVGPFGTIDPANVGGMAGTRPVFANVDTNSISPFDPAVAGGNAFDLSVLAGDRLVQSGAVNLSAVRYLRLVDVHGDGTNLDDAGRPIYDPTGFPSNGFDLDAVAVINGLTIANQWSGPGGGSFSDPARWTGGVVPTDAAIFGSNLQSSATVTVDQAVSLDTIELDSAWSYTLAGPSPIALGEDGPASITVLAGSHIILAPLQLLGDVTIDASGGVLTLGGPISWGSDVTLRITGGIINFGLPPASPPQAPSDTPEPSAAIVVGLAMLALGRRRTQTAEAEPMQPGTLSFAPSCLRGAFAFTLVELLVAVGIIALLIAILLPALSAARQSAAATACSSNLRQLAIASLAYAWDNHGHWPPAHVNYLTKNLHRWHGTRASKSEPFDSSSSPLQPYLQTDQVRRCPAFVPDKPGFEASAGGYGYNAAYLGSGVGVAQSADIAMGPAQWEARVGNVPARMSQVQRPAEKIAFADAAMAAGGGLIEYSFVEPPTTAYGPSSPSMHFRHRGRVNIAWADGHVTSHALEWTCPTNVYGADNAAFSLGFFGPRDNALFQRD